MITSVQAEKLNKNETTNQDVQLGSALRSALIAIDFEVTADATSGLTIPVLYGIKIREVVVQCTATNGAGTLTLRTSTNAISDAIVCAVDTTIGRAGTLDNDYTTIAKDGNLNVISNGAADRGVITVFGVPV